MAISGTEVEFMGPGIEARDPANGSYVQNMIHHNGSWSVRKGFGVVGEWSSTLSRSTETPGTLISPEGYEEHLGSYLMKTNFGHKQIISIFYANLWKANGVVLSAYSNSRFSSNTRSPHYVVSIYDLTTRHRWEEPLYIQTADLVSSPATRSRMPFIHGHYETSADNDYSKQLLALPEQFSFTEFDDVLYFGNKAAGLWSYKPAAYNGDRGGAVELMCNAASTTGYSESSVFTKLTLTEGIFSDAYSYLLTLEGVSGLSQLGTRLIYLTDHSIYFSDKNYPGSVVAGHFLSIPSENPITACREINGNLLIFTKSETFLYQPTESFFINQGQLTKISETVGCLSVNSIIKFSNTLAWIDSNGIYFNGGTMEIKTQSNSIKPFFERYLPNPLSSFHIEQGKTDLDHKQPRISHKLNEKNVTLCYDHDLRVLLVNIPEERVTLVYNENAQWSIWNYDSMAFSVPAGRAGSGNKVGVRDYMDCQQLLSDGTDLYAVGLDIRPENKIASDQASTYNRLTGVMEPDVNRDQGFRTYFITRYGRGGGLDRSIHDEDYRYGIGEWHELIATPGTYGYGGVAIAERFDFIIGQPKQIEPDWSIDSGTIPADKGILLPIQIRIPYATTGILPKGTGKLNTGSDRTLFLQRMMHSFKFQLVFDSVHWAPFLDTGTEKVKMFWTAGKQLMGSGMGDAEINYAMVAGVRECQLYDAFSGALSATGNKIQFAWSGNAAADPNKTTTFADLGTTFSIRHFSEGNLPVTGIGLDDAKMPITTETIFTIGYIPFYRKAATSAVSEMAIQDVVAAYQFTPAAGPPDQEVLSNNYVWKFSSLGSSTSANREDNVAQGVDWAYASQPIVLDEGSQVKARGLYAQVKSHGMSAEHFDNGWFNDPNVANYRLFNGVVSADNTQWMGQVVDQPSATNPSTAINETDTKTSIGFPNLPATGEAQSIRTKVLDTNKTMKYKQFGETSNTWGADDATSGTVLIDDPQFGTISTSTSTRGEWVNWMFFGYVLDKAESLVIRSAKAVLRKISGRRRRGHSGGKD